MRIGNLSYYLDSLPTNCVADWVCPAGTGVGYPDYTLSDGPEYGFYNLAVFYHGCSFDCAFCQNWHHREKIEKPNFVSAEKLASEAKERVSCICYFGGDPTPQFPHSLLTSRLALKNKGDQILRICWETNGSAKIRFLDRALNLALRSGGCIKFDLKAYAEELNIALTGVSNKRTLENFSSLGKHFDIRQEPPVLVASTLLVPGYIDSNEVSKIAKFIYKINPDIPYSLLAFYPCYRMDDLPITSHKQAKECLITAKEVGLNNVRIGNVHLLL